MYRKLSEQADDPVVRNEMLELASVSTDLHHMPEAVACWIAFVHLSLLFVISVSAPTSTCGLRNGWSGRSSVIVA
jgi:hypothetical protein